MADKSLSKLHTALQKGFVNTYRGEELMVEGISEDDIYAVLGTGEFKLYEAIVLADEYPESVRRAS